MVQVLLLQETKRCLGYAIRIQQLVRDNNFLNNVMSDEAHFHLNRYINKQNRFWGIDNPRELHQCQLHPLKCTVWGGIVVLRVIGSYFFKNEEGQLKKIHGDLYMTTFENILKYIRMVSIRNALLF